MKRLSLIISLLCFSIWTQAQILNVSDFGIKPNTFFDVTESIQQVINASSENENTTIVFPKGRYDFWPDKAEKREYFITNTSSETDCPSKVKSIGLLFENKKNITIEGNGSLFVFHGKMTCWAIDKSENVKVQNISVDFERPTMSEMTFLEVYPHSIIAAIHPDSKYAVIDNKLNWYGEKWGMNTYFTLLVDTIQGTNMYSSSDPIQQSKATVLTPLKVKFEGDFSNTNYKAGKIFTLRDHIRDHVGVFVNLSKNVQFENLNMHYMHGLGIVSQFSENLYYKNINIVPSHGRAIAAFADGMHFSGCKGSIKIDSCHFKGLHDDPVNVHGTYLQIREINAPNFITVKFMHAQTYGMPAFFENDSIAFVHSPTLQTKGFSIIKSVKRLSDREIQLELTKPLPKEISKGDAIENITWTPSLDIRNCKFEMTNTRGLLVTTPKQVVIENNHFYRTGMYAIMIAADAGSWYESGAVNDVLIRNNIFEECGYNIPSKDYVIAIIPENHEYAKNYWVHRNIKIENNTFKINGNLILKAKSTQGLIFKNNLIEYAPFVSPLDKNLPKTNESFDLDNCSKVIISNNIYKLPSQISVNYNRMKQTDIKSDKNTKLTHN